MSFSFLPIGLFLAFIGGYAEELSRAQRVSFGEQKTRNAQVILANYSEAEMLGFKIQHQVHSQADLFVQQLVGKSQLVKNEMISLENRDLANLDIFTSYASVVADGTEKNAASSLFVSRQDPAITIALESEGNLREAVRLDPEIGKTISISRIDSRKADRFVTITAEDFDQDKLASFEVEDRVAPLARQLRSSHKSGTSRERSLQAIGACSEYGFDVIEVAVVVDSLLCAAVGGTEVAASTVAQSVIAGASQFYEVDGLCKKLRISYLEIHCNAGTDPIAPLLQRAGNSDICNTDANGLLQNFIRYTVDQGIAADLNLLFHGKFFTVSGSLSVGCAFTGTLCLTDGTDSGVNQINFTTDPVSRAKLVAHEVGHILSAVHINDQRDIMFQSLCPTCNTFGPMSKLSINDEASTASCVSREEAPSTSQPVAMPTRSPSGTSSPTKAPFVTPMERPTQTPVEDPTNSFPIQTPLANPMESPPQTPGGDPTVSPSIQIPVNNATFGPTLIPLVNPTNGPTWTHNESSTNIPTQNPVEDSTNRPTRTSLDDPIDIPMRTPVDVGTKHPSKVTGSPTLSPNAGTARPTDHQTSSSPTLDPKGSPRTPANERTAAPLTFTTHIPTPAPYKINTPSSILTKRPTESPDNVKVCVDNPDYNGGIFRLSCGQVTALFGSKRFILRLVCRYLDEVAKNCPETCDTDCK
jgi:hypothetical protein